jgi:hypothetical protein
MSFPIIGKKSRRAASTGRMASQFCKRLGNGVVIDRTKTQAGSKMRVTVAVPKALRVTSGGTV